MPQDDITLAPDSSTPHIERPANVRLAGPDDEPALYDLLCALEDDNGFNVPKSEARVREAIQIGTRRQGGMIGVIDRKKGRYGEGKDEIAASVALTLQRFWYSDQWFLGEGWLFVRPEYRSNHFDRDLFQFAKWCGQDLGVPLVLSMWGNKKLDLKMKLWSRHAKHVGGIFLVAA